MAHLVFAALKPASLPGSIWGAVAFVNETRSAPSLPFRERGLGGEGHYGAMPRALTTILIGPRPPGSGAALVARAK